MREDVSHAPVLPGWGLCSFALGMKYINERGVPASTSVVIAQSWQPKEDWSSFQCGLVTLFTVLETNNIPLRTRLRCVLLDGAPGAEKAVRILLPHVPVTRDLRHVTENARKKACGEKAVGRLLAAEVQWTAYLPGSMLFHHTWSQILVHNQCRDLHALNKYITTTLLQWQAGFRVASYTNGETLKDVAQDSLIILEAMDGYFFNS